MTGADVAGGEDAGTAERQASPCLLDVVGDLADLDPEDSRPPSRQIADRLRALILSGRLAPEAKLPSQNQLSSRYGVARETVKTALRQLAIEGLIVTRQGSGSFVKAQGGDEAASRSVPTRFVAALEGLREVHDEATSLIKELPDSRQAFECSTRLFGELQELAEATATLRAETAVKVASERRETER